MDVRKKLVELLGANTCKCDYCEDCEYCEDEDACVAYLKNSMADYLIAHGVTVQEWISVDDRLPEDSTTVNLHTRSRTVGTGFYDKHTKSWVQYYSGGAICVDVTHWQPMPKPPKGE